MTYGTEVRELVEIVKEVMSSGDKVNLEDKNTLELLNKYFKELLNSYNSKYFTTVLGNITISDKGYVKLNTYTPSSSDIRTLTIIKTVESLIMNGRAVPEIDNLYYNLPDGSYIIDDKTVVDELLNFDGVQYQPGFVEEYMKKDNVVRLYIKGDVKKLTIDLNK